MKESFSRAWRFTMMWEGGGKVHTVPGDPGGTTKWGIAQVFHPTVDVRNLTEHQAQQIARREYWDKCRCDDLPYPIDVLVWDAAFNMGVGRGAKFLQRSLRSLGYYIVKPNLGTPWKVDGDIGPGTIGETKMALASGDDNLRTLVREFQLHRIRFYNRRIANSPSQVKFITGWLNRSFALLIEIGIKELDEPY